MGAVWKTKSLLLVPIWGALFWLCLSAFCQASANLTPYSVSVRGYYRSDGTYVSPHSRRPPGSVAHDAPYESTRSLCLLGMVACIGLVAIPLWLLVQRTRDGVESESLKALATSVLDESPVSVSEGTRARLAAVMAARATVTIEYVDYHGTRTTRTISPIAWMGRDMLVARCHLRGGQRHFRVSRIARVLEQRTAASPDQRSHVA